MESHKGESSGRGQLAYHSSSNSLDMMDDGAKNLRKR